MKKKEGDVYSGLLFQKLSINVDVRRETRPNTYIVFQDTD